MGLEDDQALLFDSSLPSSSTQLTKPPVKRTGNIWTALAHIITAVIGSGVLSLAWSMAQLGWIAGPLTMIFFGLISVVSAFLMCNCYRSVDPGHELTRNGSYLEAVGAILGNRSAWVCGIVVHINYIKLAIVYTITSAISMRAIQMSNCYHYKGHMASCEYGNTYYMLLFGIIQIIVSQLPDIHSMEWLSIISATMSFTYSIVGSVLSIAKVIGDGKIRGSIGGVVTSTAIQKVWLVSQALGDIAFAFPFSLVLLNIQDTLKSPPSEVVTMKKTSAMAVCLITIFYFSCGGFGYAAFGNSAPGNLLTGFGFYEPYWLIDFANACIVVHLIGGYQIFSQPLFATAEKWLVHRLPNIEFVYDNYSMKFPLLPAFRLNLLRLCFRTAYVASATGVALIVPYFNQVVAVSGGLTFWPVVIYFPVEMYLVQKNIGAWTWKWILLRACTIFFFLLMIYVLVGSLEGLITAKFGEEMQKETAVFVN